MYTQLRAMLTSLRISTGSFSDRVNASIPGGSVADETGQGRLIGLLGGVLII